MKASIREALWFHALFFAVALPMLLLAHGNALGDSLMALAIAYNVLLPALGMARGHTEWLRLWGFLLPLSCGQILPDWALADIAQVLTLPGHGIWRFGGQVPLYFLGLWMMLLFPVLLVCDGSRRRYAYAFLLSLALFALCEWAAPRLQLWQGHGVRQVAGVAVYTLIPEALLGVHALWMYRMTRDDGVLPRLFGAFSVNLFYTGAVFVGLLFDSA